MSQARRDYFTFDRFQKKHFMAYKEERFNQRRLRSSYLSVVVSISLVLFVLGLFGILLLNANEIARSVKENFAVTVLLNNEASPASVGQMQKSLQLKDFVKQTEFISKEEAAAELAASLDEDFIDFLGYNPLYNALEIRLKAEYLSELQLSELEEELLKMEQVHEVVYDRNLAHKMNDNIERIGLLLVGGALLLSLVSIALINSSIRLAIYSRRFLIKTMQLVGATKGFIRRPFIWRSLRHGIYGALVAGGLLALVISYLYRTLPGFAELQSPLELSILGLGILLAGLLISLSCTLFALRKYLKLKTDQLYF